jgi:L-amino acid N-acyltransferase YncA
MKQNVHEGAIVPESHDLTVLSENHHPAFTFHEATTDEERIEAAKLGVKVFGAFSTLMIPSKPKWVIYAKDETGEMMGAVLLSHLGTCGYVDFIFVGEKARGKSLGPQLLRRGLLGLENAGYKKQLAIIRDDNTPSWNMFAKAGFKRPDFFMAHFGYSYQLIFYLFALPGYSLWVLDPEYSNFLEFLWLPRFILAILFDVLLGAVAGRFGAEGLNRLLYAIAVISGVSFVRLVVSFVAARPYGPLRYTMSHGNVILSLGVGISGGWVPYFGFWSPNEELWHLSTFRKYQGISSLGGWLVTMIAYALTLFPNIPVLNSARGVLITPTILQAMPGFPWEGSDGYRVAQWNMYAYVFGLVGTLVCLGYQIFLWVR